MAPLLNNEGSKGSKMIFKSITDIWKKVKTPKGKNKKDTSSEDEWAFDSEPTQDYFSKKKPSEDSGFKPGKSKNTFNEDPTSKDEPSSYESDEEFTKEKRRDTKKTRKAKDSKTQIVYNLKADNCESVQIGDVKNVTKTYYVQQSYTAGVPGKATKSENNTKLTAKIEAALQSTDKLGRNHIEWLSKHLGKSYRKIGQTLQLSSGQIDQIEKDCEKDPKKMSSEILVLWAQMNGENATIGRLCELLWESRIARAREAVKLFADNIENF